MDAETSRVASPCAACKMQRKKCGESCVFAPYFPSDNPRKFADVHKVFRSGNVLKMLQDVPIEKRADTVNSLVYEASARLRDPVYGCTNAICQLQRQMSELQSQLATAQAELVDMRSQQTSLLSSISGFGTSGEAEHSYYSTDSASHKYGQDLYNDLVSADEDPLQLWEPLWT